MSDERADERPNASDEPPTDDHDERNDERPDEDGPENPALPDPTVPVAEALGLTPASEVARAGLNRAKAAARARGFQPGSPGARTRRGRGAAELSGSGKDGRDPTLLGDTLARMATERGWTQELSVAGVVGRWRELVGDQVADHCTPETFDDGLLVVRTDSTAWATNLRMLVPELLARLEREVGPDVVREVRVLGPAGPGWGKGPRRVRGRGPRDTYG